MKHSGIGKEPFICNSKIHKMNFWKASIFEPVCTFNGICTSPVILLGNQALASPSKFPESRNVECSSDLVVSGWPMIFKALLSICGHDFLTPLQNWKILGRHQEEPWKNNIPIPFFGSFFFWAEDLEGTILPDQKESLACLHDSSIREAQWRHGDGRGKNTSL